MYSTPMLKLSIFDRYKNNQKQKTMVLFNNSPIHSSEISEPELQNAIMDLVKEEIENGDNVNIIGSIDDDGHVFIEDFQFVGGTVDHNYVIEKMHLAFATNPGLCKYFVY